MLTPRNAPHLSSSQLRAVLVSLCATFCAVLLARLDDQRTAAAPLAAGHTFVVTSTFDAPDFDTGDNTCASAGHGCTLRAAVDQANFTSDPDTITLPAGSFLLTRPGDEDNNVLGDLDIKYTVTVLGAGPGLTIVDGNGALTGDRVFQILSSATEVTLSNLTIRNGRQLTATFASGGGLYWTGGGGHLHLSNVSVESNQAHYGGGIYLDYASAGGDVTLDNVSFRANRATTAAGGGLVVALNGPLMDFAMRNSQVYSNTAFQGGGIYLQSTIVPFSTYSATIESSQIYSNTAGHGAGIDNDSGDGSHRLTILDSRLHHNHSASLAGGIENNGGLSILRSTLDTNSAATQGGGIYNNDNGLLEITQSTLSGNTAQFGAGIFVESFIYMRTLASVVNSTISGNTASHEGAGLYNNGGRAQFYNATIANNQIVVPMGNFYPAMGGGLLITPNFGINAVVTIQNTLIGDNVLRAGANPPQADDCHGTVRPEGYNLIETLAHCGFENPSIGDITGQDPKLGPLQNNGGRTATQALLPGSPAIDTGRPAGCTDATGAPLVSDQRGFRRPLGARCDIGAFEYSPYALALPIIRR